MKVAVAHDWLTTLGGSEKVLQHILALYPDAAVITAAARPDTVAQILPPSATLVPLWTDKLPMARDHWQMYLPLIMRAWKAKKLGDVDLLLSSSHACAKAMGFGVDAPHVSYCHTPMRYAWRTDLEVGRVSPWLRPGMRAAAVRLRRWDLSTATTVDAFVANSNYIAGRINECYERSADVVYPPVEVGRFLSKPRNPRNFFLAAGRIVPYKRFDVAVKVFTQLGLPLVVAGDGPDVAGLKKLAGPSVRFLGRVDDETWQTLLAEAIALVFPGEEDFGIVPVEAQAAGCPVIALRAGGAKETVVDGTTGVFFDEADGGDLPRAIERIRDIQWDPELIRGWSTNFAPDVFAARLRAVVEATLASGRTDVPSQGRTVEKATQSRLQYTASEPPVDRLAPEST